MKLRKEKSHLIRDSINYEDNIEAIITELKLVWKEKKITIETIHLLLKDAMEIVDNFNCSGNEKKQHVNLIVKTIIIELIEDPNDEKLIIDIIDKNVLGNTMDLIILASQGKLDIKTKKTQNKLISCFGFIIGIIIKFIKSKKTKPKKALSEQSPQLELEPKPPTPPPPPPTLPPLTPPLTPPPTPPTPPPEEPAPEEPTPEEPEAEEPTPEEPTPEEPTPEEPTPEEPEAEEPTPEEPTPEEPTPEEPEAEEPTPEEPGEPAPAP
jgi:hypothetical protein